MSNSNIEKADFVSAILDNRDLFHTFTSTLQMQIFKIEDIEDEEKDPRPILPSIEEPNKTLIIRVLNIEH